MVKFKDINITFFFVKSKNYENKNKYYTYSYYTHSTYGQQKSDFSLSFNLVSPFFIDGKCMWQCVSVCCSVFVQRCKFCFVCPSTRVHTNTHTARHSISVRVRTAYNIFKTCMINQQSCSLVRLTLNNAEHVIARHTICHMQFFL